MNKKNLVLVRHGESLWNQENRFTGWNDVNLSEKGLQEALKAGKFLQTKGFEFDCAFTSVLRRAIHTLYKILDETNCLWIPVKKSWRLNERHYGALQGLNKAETIAKHGAAQVAEWRRSLLIKPPKMALNSSFFTGHEKKYSCISS